MAVPWGHRAAEQNEGLQIGGTEDHVHILLSLPSTMPIAKAMQLIKGGSSKWIHETFPEQRLFAWQKKYGAFGVSFSLLDTITDYIKNQHEHHRHRSFQEEFLALLKKQACRCPRLSERRRVLFPAYLPPLNSRT